MGRIWVRQTVWAAALATLVSCSGEWRRGSGDLSRQLGTVRWSELRPSFDLRATACAPSLGETLGCDSRLGWSDASRRIHGVRSRLRSATGVERGRLRIVLEALGSKDRGSRGDLLQAIAQAPEDADLWNDLAVSYALAAEREGMVSPLFRALETLTQALARAPDHPHALFNRGVVLERIGLAEDAARSWQALSRLELPESWQTEIQDRLRRAESRSGAGSAEDAAESILAAASANPAATMRAWQTAVTGLTEPRAWADYCAGGRQTWEALGELVAERYGELLPAATAAWLKERCDGSTTVSEGRTHLALRHLAEGLEAAATSLGTGGGPRLRLAEETLAALRSPLAWLARLRAATEALADERYESSRNELAALAPELERLGYRQLASRAWWGLGTIALRQGRPEVAIAHYETARETLAAGIDPQASALLTSLAASAFSQVGDYERAWTLGVEALHTIRGLPDRTPLSAICNQLAEISAHAEEWEISLRFQNCVADNVSRDEDPAYRSDAHVWRALCHHKLGDDDAAAEDLETARTAARLIADREERGLADATIDLVQGFALEETSPDRAAEHLGSASRYFSGVGHRINEFLARVGSLDLALGSGDLPRAERLLVEVDSLYQALHEETASDALALTLLGRGTAISDRAVRLHLDLRDDPWAALAASDRARTRRGAPMPEPAEMRALADRLPADVALLALTWLEGRVTGFLLRKGREVATARARDTLDLRFVAAIAIPDSDSVAVGWHTASRELHRVLIEPHASDLEDGAHLIVVPDGPLFAVPFGVLRRPGDRYLMEDLSVSVAPSLQVLLEGSRDVWSLQRAPEVLAIVDPRPSPDEGLGRLAGARAEAERMVAALSSRVRVLSDENATPSAFLEALASYDVLHFGGHSRLVATDPVRSYLALAPDEAHPDGRLTADALYQQRFQRPRLVVLASCSSASAGRDLPYALSLVRPLLEGGVPRVIGSLRDLDDDLFRAVMEVFYQQLARGLSPLEALRQAQLAKLRDPSNPEAIPAAGFIQLYRGGMPTTLGEAT